MERSLATLLRSLQTSSQYGDASRQVFLAHCRQIGVIDLVMPGFFLRPRAFLRHCRIRRMSLFSLHTCCLLQRFGQRLSTYDPAGASSAYSTQPPHRSTLKTQQAQQAMHVPTRRLHSQVVVGSKPSLTGQTLDLQDGGICY